MAVCSECGATNREGSRFCNECGHRLETERKCPSCGQVNILSAKFCDECGVELGAARSALAVVGSSVAPASQSISMGVASPVRVATEAAHAPQRTDVPQPSPASPPTALDAPASSNEGSNASVSRSLLNQPSAPEAEMPAPEVRESVREPAPEERTEEEEEKGLILARSFRSGRPFIRPTLLEEQSSEAGLAFAEVTEDKPSEKGQIHQRAQNAPNGLLVAAVILVLIALVLFLFFGRAQAEGLIDPLAWIQSGLALLG